MRYISHSLPCKFDRLTAPSRIQGIRNQRKGIENKCKIINQVNVEQLEG